MWLAASHRLSLPSGQTAAPSNEAALLCSRAHNGNVKVADQRAPSGQAPVLCTLHIGQAHSFRPQAAVTASACGNCMH